MSDDGPRPRVVAGDLGSRTQVPTIACLLIVSKTELKRSRRAAPRIAHDREQSNRSIRVRLPRSRSDHAWSRTASEAHAPPGVCRPRLGPWSSRGRPSGTRAPLPRRTPSPTPGLDGFARRTRPEHPDPARRRTVWESTRRPYRPRSSQPGPRRARCRGTAAPRGASRVCSWRQSARPRERAQLRAEARSPALPALRPVRRDRATGRTRPRAEGDGELTHSVSTTTTPRRARPPRGGRARAQWRQGGRG